MRARHLPTGLLCVILLGVAARADAGTVSKVTANPTTAAAGTPIAVTVEGTNPCGAAHIDYGDGVAITYAITGLPTTHPHTYKYGGSFTIVARGMGNCDGEARIAVEIRGPPAPPAPQPEPAPRITSVTFAPPEGTVRKPVTIAIGGEGTCVFSIDYGDGNSQDFTAKLPHKVNHTYALPETYTVIVAPAAPCIGRFTERLVVTPSAEPARITGMRLSGSAVAGRSVEITVLGSGACSYAIDFGDGNNDSRTASLPDTVRHTYPATGTYDVMATAISPCTGSAYRRLQILRR